jgi:ATP-dependent Lon protease
MDKIIKKKNKYSKILNIFYSRLSIILNHLNYLYELKIFDNDFYNDKINNLNDINVKIEKLDNYSDKKRINKNFIDNLIKEITESINRALYKSCCNTYSNILGILFPEHDFLNNLTQENKELLEIIDNYFIPLSCNFISDKEKFFKSYNIENSNDIIIKNLIDISKNKNLIEKIEGASIIFNIPSINKILYVNGFFKKDSLNICKIIPIFQSKNNIIKEEIEFIDIPNEFKENYIKQLSLKDFIVLNPNEIFDMMKNDYNDFTILKNKALSQLIKEFTKSSIERQRKIITLFLISDQESQFTAHIIFDLISDQMFLSETQQQLSDVLFNSLHWSIQKSFKVSNTKFEESKKKIQNLTVNDVPYESRILALKAPEHIKAKAMEKIKEVNGSKENSIKAQQWLDGFLKIPYGVYKKEPIIDFFKLYQEKIETYINIFTIKLSEFEILKLNERNNEIYNLITQIVDEYHSIIFKSENSYTVFLDFVMNLKESIKNKLLYNNDFISNNEDDIGYNMDDENNEKNNDDSIVKTIIFYNKIINNIIDSNIIDNKSVNNIEKSIIEIDNFKKIENNNEYKSLLNDLENILKISLLKSDEDDDESNNDESLSIIQYNYIFTKFVIKNIYEFNNYYCEWSDFKNRKKKYMTDVDVILDKCVYGQNDAKKQMKRIIGQWMNGISKGQCFGLCGPPGVGKTTICKNGLAKCLFDEHGVSRPFAFLPLGGATNGSFLEGHHYTYLGSTWGKIVDILMETKCMNPIIYIDELDKISKTEQGREIASLLTHITDQSQNKEFYDKYFTSIPFDLSQILFIFSYNDRENIDSILRDRIQEITIKPLTRNEKLIITKNYLCPDIYHNVGYSPDEIIISKDALSILIEEYTYEAGVRKLNEILYDVVRDINLKKIVNDIIDFPIHIDKTYIKKFMEDKSKITKKVINDVSRVGLVNGLYATSAGLGGLTVIQVMKTFSDKKLAIERMTGSLGDVMKDSLNLALTMSWNIIPDTMKDLIISGKENYGLHVHCPDLSTSKDGPSASLAFCLAFVSRLCNIPVKNTVALTGEMDLLGNSMAIGGLESKLMGAINAGVKTVLIPRENEEDLDIIIRKDVDELELLKKNSSFKNFDISIVDNNNTSVDIDKNKKIFRNKLTVYIVDNIYDVLKYALEENNLIFKKMF